MATKMTDVKDVKDKEVKAEEVKAEEVKPEEVKPEETAEGCENAGENKGTQARKTASKTINDAIKQLENLGKALGNALQDRANVVAVRINNDSLRYLDMLIESDITKSRSDGAAFLINEGIKANEQLFNKIRNITDQISSLKSQLRETVKVEED